MDLFESERPVFTLYRSGASAKADAAGFAAGGVPVGITALDASHGVLRALGAYASEGGRVFCDSGAFRLFMRGEILDYGAVLAAYRVLIDATTQPQNLLVVAPDVVGDQAGSIALLEAWLKPVLALLDQGVRVMVPLQRGEQSIEAVYRQVHDLLGARSFVAGLPSNAAALSEDEICTFVRAVKPNAVHFLGCKERAIFHRLLNIHPSLEISSDASTLRAYIGKDRPLTRAHHAHRDDALESELRGEGSQSGDITELYADLDQLLVEEPRWIRSLAKALQCNVFELKQAALDEGALNFIEGCQYGYGVQVLDRWWCAQICAIVSPQSRERTIADFVRNGVL